MSMRTVSDPSADGTKMVYSRILLFLSIQERFYFVKQSQRHGKTIVSRQTISNRQPQTHHGEDKSFSLESDVPSSASFFVCAFDWQWQCHFLYVKST